MSQVGECPSFRVTGTLALEISERERPQDRGRSLAIPVRQLKWKCALVCVTKVQLDQVSPI